MQAPNIVMKNLFYNDDTCSLGTFFPFSHLKFDGLTLFQRTESLSRNTGIVYKNVFTLFGRDEAVTFRSVEPFY